MTNNCFIDSSVLIEFNNGRKTTLLTTLLNKPLHECFINEVVLSEFLYHYIARNSGKSPRAVQSSKSIHHVFENSQQHKLINLFTFLPTSDTLFYLVPTFMAKYNLLPNDAIILATCKIHNINTLASHDSDFIVPCKTEGIELLREE